MAEFQEYTLPSSNGINDLHVIKRTADNPKAIVQIAHGLVEHIERYKDFFEFLSEHGFIVVGGDHLGHGKSAGDTPGFFADEDGWSKVVNDLHLIYEKEHAEMPHLPYFLFGHSMGSFLARTYITRFGAELKGAVICGTGYMSPLILAGGKFVAKGEIKKNGAKAPSEKMNKLSFGSYNKRFAPTHTDFDWLSRDNEKVDEYIQDPMCGFVPSAGLFLDMLGGMQYNQNVENIKKTPSDLPILLTAGAVDPVGGEKGVNKTASLMKQAGLKDVTVKLYPEARHEILNETNRAEVYSDVLAWFESKF